MWRLCSKIYFIGNSFWKFYEVRSEREDFNSDWSWPYCDIKTFWSKSPKLIKFSFYYKFYFCLTLTWNSTIWVFHNAYSLAWALRMLDGIFKDLNDRWLNLSGSKSTQRCVSFSWKFRRKIELIFCPKLSAQFQYMYLTKQCQVCFKIWSPLHVFRELKATTYFPDTTVNQN